MTAPEDFHSEPLDQFIGCYFHQDSDAEALSALMSEATVRPTSKRCSPGTVRRLPAGDDGAQTHAEWLEEIAQRLAAALSGA